jgi:tRNA(Ile)-lysidine synthase
MNPAEFVEHFTASFSEFLGRRVLVALSGGADSVALLSLLESPELDLDIEAAHVHHGVRGDEADADARFCESLCGELGVPFHLLRLAAEPTRVSGREGTWRQLRYRALLDLKQTGEFAAVATGHHRDDVAEGVLVQMLRGGGPRALSGISPKTASGVIRPLLPWNRFEISSWLEHNETPWREDSSNLDLSLLRNRVRHQILPGLEAASPSIRGHLVHLAESLASTESFLSGEVMSRASWIDPWDPDGGVALARIRDLPDPLRVRWLHGQARRVGIERVSRRHNALFDAMVRSEKPRAVTLGQRWTLRLVRARLWLEPLHFPQLAGGQLVVGDALSLPLPGWQIRMVETPTATSGLRWSLPVSPGTHLSVRRVHPGDRVEIDGTPIRVVRIYGRVIPRHLRQAWPVFCKGDRIHWIPGVWQGAAETRPGSHFVEVTRREQSASGLQR